LAVRPASKTGAGFRWRIFPTIKGLADLVVPVDAVGDLADLVVPAGVDVDLAVPVALVVPADVPVDRVDGAVMAATSAMPARTCTRT
jgi:hypothetical protein